MKPLFRLIYFYPFAVLFLLFSISQTSALTARQMEKTRLFPVFAPKRVYIKEEGKSKNLDEFLHLWIDNRGPHGGEDGLSVPEHFGQAVVVKDNQANTFPSMIYDFLGFAYENDTVNIMDNQGNKVINLSLANNASKTFQYKVNGELYKIKIKIKKKVINYTEDNPLFIHRWYFTPLEARKMQAFSIEFDIH